jgi:hypothetical protein
MRKQLPQRDPIRTIKRKATALRRVGLNAQCACGESRAEALIAGSMPVICADYDRKRRGKTPIDEHHVAGKANSPVTTPMPVNDHRAILSVAQYDWPTETLENPDGSPVLAIAARSRGYVDTDEYLKRQLLLPKWWINTEMEQFAPKRGSNVKSKT